MGLYRKTRRQSESLRLLSLAMQFVARDGAGYSLADGSIDAGDEDRYVVTLHVKERLLEFEAGWLEDPKFVPLVSEAAVSLLRFLRKTDAPSASGDALIEGLRAALRRLPPVGPIKGIFVGTRISE